jgi:hypothetical protein
MKLLLVWARNLLFVFDYLPVVIRYLLIQLKLLNQLQVSHANATLVVLAPMNARLMPPKLAERCSRQIARY